MALRKIREMGEECLRCKCKEITEVTPKLEHIFREDETKEASCSEEGYVKRICLTCDAIETVIIENKIKEILEINY